MRSFFAIRRVSDDKELLRSRKIWRSKMKREEMKPRPLFKGAGGGKRREGEDSLIGGAPFSRSVSLWREKGERPRVFRCVLASL